METTKKKLSLRKEEIASFDEQKNTRGGGLLDPTVTCWSDQIPETEFCETKAIGCWGGETWGGAACATGVSCVPASCAPECVIIVSQFCAETFRCYAPYTDGC